MNKFPASGKKGQSIIIGRHMSALITPDDPDDIELKPIYTKATAAYFCQPSDTYICGAGTSYSAPRGKSYTITILSTYSGSQILFAAISSSGSAPGRSDSAYSRTGSQVSAGMKYKVVVDASSNKMYVYDSNNTLLGTSSNMTSSSTRVFYIAAI